MTLAKFASLHGGLLVRKGDAAPATSLFHSRQQARTEQWRDSAGFAGNERRDAEQAIPDAPQDGGFDEQALVSAGCCMRGDGAGQDHESGAAVVVPLGGTGKAAPAGGAGTGIAERSDGRYQVTVRLTGEQRRRLITASAQLGVIPAKLAARALDAYLDELAEHELHGCACVRRRYGVD